MIFFFILVKLDPDPHSEKLLDPDPHKMNADPQPCLLQTVKLSKLTVCILPPVHLQPRVEDAQSHVGRVVIRPEHVVHVQYDRLAAAATQAGRLIHLLCCRKHVLRYKI